MEYDEGEEEEPDENIDMAGQYENDDNEIDQQIKSLQEEGSVTQVHWSVIYHDNKIKVSWDIFIILLVLFNCYTIPMAVAFQNISWMRSSPYAIAEMLIDISFAIDILLAFRTTFITPGGNLESDPKTIAKTYLCSKDFPIDLAATIPFEAVFLIVLPAGALDGDLQQYQ
jgi:hypothetical protein